MTGQGEGGIVPPVEQQAAAAVDNSPTAWRHRIEQKTAANNAALQGLAQRSVGVSEASIVGVRLDVLVTMLYGDMDTPARLAYEEAVADRFAELIATAGEQAAAQVARAQLLDGVRLDPSQLPRNGGRFLRPGQ